LALAVIKVRVLAEMGKINLRIAVEEVMKTWTYSFISLMGFRARLRSHRTAPQRLVFSKKCRSNIAHCRQLILDFVIENMYLEYVLPVPPVCMMRPNFANTWYHH